MERNQSSDYFEAEMVQTDGKHGRFSGTLDEPGDFEPTIEAGSIARSVKAMPCLVQGKWVVELANLLRHMSKFMVALL